MLKAWCFLLALLLNYGPHAALAAPRNRIVSLNLCTDELVLMLARPENIVGLSPMVRDCQNSVLCMQARTVPTLRVSAESVVAHRPDLVLGGTYTARVAMQVARTLGLPVVTLRPADKLDDIPAQIMTVADAIGEPERGRQLVADFRARLKAISFSDPHGPIAAIYAANGFVTQPGSLPDDVLRHAGFQNYAARKSAGHMARLPLENLIAHPPDLLILDRSGKGYSIAQSMLDNPVLQNAFPETHKTDIPARLWLCGLPQTLDVIARLKTSRAALDSFR
ncbi:ABC transporter substrate-binding protein [Acetobacter orleanensis]|uniref:Cobalamin ABC transporter substrate-binding protein n=1 Tax=Acetobacter orleanensis TaxID=104099 RepID=A0A4Y3TGZ4_9PROT|nr:ABC transporter substrate-binding protein [Acetobacter orleanensis]GAN69056.1 ABC transporter ferrichrome transport [Acetobacter orleanensis JCM 7639]GBR30278.1 ferrichrome ABC transporter substrate-binding protein [Acetobacter orleanensis NRIC 0473]GEB81536.1 cobalamin ABC transporter substrate-binding protein [Acetobacter orleanensis]